MEVTERVRLPMKARSADWQMLAFRDGDGDEYLVIVLGDLTTGTPVVRLHSGCLTGDILASERCDCGPQLIEAMRMIEDRTNGLVVYAPHHEGRGIGIFDKVRAYHLQDQGLDTYAANRHIGAEADAREFTSMVDIVARLGVNRCDLLTNSPAKEKAARDGGLLVGQVLRVHVGSSEHNVAYLDAKRDVGGHSLPASGRT